MEVEVAPVTTTFAYMAGAFSDALAVKVTVVVDSGPEARNGERLKLVLLLLGLVGGAVAVFFAASLLAQICIKNLREDVLAFERVPPAGPVRRTSEVMATTKECVCEEGNRYGQTQCAICMAEFEPRSKVRRLACGHIFHGRCIECWVRSTIMKRPRCPICNVSINSQEKA